jgi:hypothetical protein
MRCFLTYLVIGLFSALAVVYYGVAHAELMTEDSVKKLPTGADDAEKISSPMGVILACGQEPPSQLRKS